ncbi:MAG: restriction endonuclease subunit S, partial [Bacteroidetes bacterium]|nr:restriction endonuclease subunit S [Bacteroidota bacterium]
SSEIECLFVERTKQLLKDGGVAGIILPSSILSNEGIYTKTREIILKYFEIVAITELGSNTFMATGTNTVVLFLRRRNNYDTINLRESVERFFTNFQDVALNGIEKPFSKYVNHVWEGLSWEDYLSLLKNNPYDFIEKESELYKEYRRKLNVRTEKEFWQKFIETEKEKLLYFILAYPQKVVLVKTGEKDAEKRFLGYEFSNRRGSEGIHPIQRGKTIDECTKLFDDERFDNEEKASTYIYKAFANDYEFPIHESLKDNIYRIDLVDTLSFDRAFFDKSVNTNAQRKIKFDSKYGTVILDYLVTFQSGLWKGEKGDLQTVKVLRNTNFKFNNGKLSYDDVAEIEVEIKQLENRKLEYGDIILEKSGGSDTQAIGRVVLFDKKDNKIYSFSNFCTRIRVKDENIINPIYLWTILNDFYNKGGTIPLQNGVRLLNIDFTGYSKIKIPLPPKEIQEKIVAEIEVLEKEEGEAKEKVKKLKSEISTIFNVDTPNNCEILKLGDVCKIKAGEFVKVGDISNENQNGLYPCYGGNGLRGYTKTYTHEGLYSLVGRQGALCGNVHLVSGKFHATEHALVVTPKLNINTIWLYHKLVSMNLNQYATGTAQPGLSVINLVPIQIPLPPLSEQQKIVSEIEKIEAQIASLDQLLSELPKQKEAVLAKHL